MNLRKNVDSSRKNLKGWLTRYGKFVLTRYGKLVLTRHGKTIGMKDNYLRHYQML